MASGAVLLGSGALLVARLGGAWAIGLVAAALVSWFFGRGRAGEALEGRGAEMTDEELKQEIRQTLAEAGIELDEAALERIVRLQEKGAAQAEYLAAVFEALGMPQADRSALTQLAQLVEGAGSEEEVVAALLIGACPHCGEEQTLDCEGEPEIEDATVGRCPACGWFWCSECGAKLTREEPECENPECWLNPPDEELDEALEQEG